MPGMGKEASPYTYCAYTLAYLNTPVCTHAYICVLTQCLGRSEGSGNVQGQVLRIKHSPWELENAFCRETLILTQ